MYQLPMLSSSSLTVLFETPRALIIFDSSEVVVDDAFLIGETSGT